VLREGAVVSIADQFNNEMLNIYRRAKTEANYTARIFLDMVVSRGGLETARALINAGRPSPGYTNLYERGHLDLTVEALVVENPRWHSLFTEVELKKARKRLSDFGYRLTAQGGG
jgi:hypothetical protein